MFTEGFVTGVNYWASNAGIKMWSNFDEKVIDKDLGKIKALKMDVVRLFPLWSDFQPVEAILGGECRIREYRFPNDEPFPDTFAGRAGIKEEMLDRFEKVLRIAEKHGLKVTVGILTGWMSGRTWVPPCLVGKNLITDPLAIRMALDFVRVFVTRFKDDPVIVGWTSGNETACLAGPGTTSLDLLNWAVNIRNAIKAVDPNRPVMDDMQRLRAPGSNEIRDRLGIFDVSTVHPYANFSPYGIIEPINSMRGLLHSVAEVKGYLGIAKNPCLVEEIGTLGDFNCSREVSAGYAKTHLYSNWANGATGMLWWCANEQSFLQYPPYTWWPLERELGVFDKEGNEKPVAKEFRNFKETIDSLPFKITPPKTDAVCVLEGGKEDWANVLGSCVLSKQAGFNIAYAHQKSYPEADVYIFPGVYRMDGEILGPLLKRVEKGATVIFTHINDIGFSDFENLTGNKVITYCSTPETVNTKVGPVEKSNSIRVKAVSSTVLLEDEEGNPVFTAKDYGKGKIYFCFAPVEINYTKSPNPPASSTEIYKMIAKLVNIEVERTNEHIGITIHQLENGKKIAVCINYSPEDITDTLTLKTGKIGKVYLGDIKGNTLNIPAYSCAIFEIE